MFFLYVTLTPVISKLKLLKVFQQKLNDVCSQTYENCGVQCKILFIANLILLANTPTPDLEQYHLQ